MLGLKRGTVTLVPHDSEWAVIFDAGRRVIAAKLGELAVGIEHIGSTAIPGMHAKPILDLTVAVKSTEDFAECIPLLEALGYQYIVRDIAPHRDDLLFVKGSDDNRTHHLKLTVINSTFWERSITLRDYLIQHPSVAKEYENIKRQLAETHADNREAYTKCKEQYIEDVLAIARGNRK